MSKHDDDSGEGVFIYVILSLYLCCLLLGIIMARDSWRDECDSSPRLNGGTTQHDAPQPA